MVQQAKEHEVHRREQIPTARQQNLPRLFGAALREHARTRRVGLPQHHEGEHHDGGHHDFVGRNGQQIGQQNDPVEAHVPRRRVEPTDEVRRDRSAAHLDVAGEPNQRTGGGGKRQRATQHDDGAVDERGVERAPKLRRTIGRQFEVERRHLAPQHGARQRPRRGEHEHNAQNQHADHGHRRHRRTVFAGKRRRHEERGQKDLRGPTTVAE